MADIYKVEWTETEGTGAMGGHRFFSGTGIAFGRSIKNARKQAQKLAYANGGEELGMWIPVLTQVKMWKNGKLFYDRID
jgi:hypothetical protein